MNDDEKLVSSILILLVFRLLFSLIGDYQSMKMLGSINIKAYFADLAYYLDPIVVPIYICSYVILICALIFVVIGQIIWNYKLGGFFVILEGAFDIIGFIIIAFFVDVSFSVGPLIDVLIIFLGVKLFKRG